MMLRVEPTEYEKRRNAVERRRLDYQAGWRSGAQGECENMAVDMYNDAYNIGRAAGRAALDKAILESMTMYRMPADEGVQKP